MSIQDQTLTFAAICQVAHLVQQCSRTGNVEQAPLNTLLASVLNTSPENTLAVYGGNNQNLALGLQVLVDHLGDKNKQKDPELTRYIISLINLERHLMKKPQALSTLAQRIEQTQRQLEHFELTSEPILASFASIYTDVISPLGTRIQVAGEPNILKQTNNQDKIRALLLAGIRSAVLWRQVGGKRRNILFSRKKIVQCAQQYLAYLN
ncbi:MAG: high frequency lysogenization protein HflD [Alteromonadaceae bacterium]|nr:high frequency lysogenization protein HflD [Alteromonadaceae bacterium]